MALRWEFEGGEGAAGMQNRERGRLLGAPELVSPFSLSSLLSLFFFFFSLSLSPY